MTALSVCIDCVQEKTACPWSVAAVHRWTCLLTGYRCVHGCTSYNLTFTMCPFVRCVHIIAFRRCDMIIENIIIVVLVSSVMSIFCHQDDNHTFCMLCVFVYGCLSRLLLNVTVLLLWLYLFFVAVVIVLLGTTFVYCFI